MSRALLGKHFDIHTGGIDHIPVHHTNEIAQSECANGCPYVNYWMHNAFLTINKGERMAKSGGASDLFSLDGIVGQGVDPLAVRYYFLGANYRTQMDFSFEALVAAQKGLKNLKKRISVLTRTENGKLLKQFAQKFDAAINDDLGTPQALATLHELLHSAEKPEHVVATIAYMDRVLGLKLLEQHADTVTAPLDIPAKIQAFLDARATARTEKRWADSDGIRDQIKAAGYEVKDTPEGQKLTVG
jgi:cysteinyl-tRNA synthetase